MGEPPAWRYLALLRSSSRFGIERISESGGGVGGDDIVIYGYYVVSSPSLWSANGKGECEECTRLELRFRLENSDVTR